MTQFLKTPYPKKTFPVIKAFSIIRAFSLLVPIGLVCLIAVQPAFSQIDQGGITGTISDTAGRAIQGATVTLVSQGTGLSFTQQSGNDGFYRFSPIKIGLYRSEERRV